VSTEDLRLHGLLKRALAQLHDASVPALAPHAVDGRELAVLSLLDRHGASSQQEISRRLGIDRTTMVALVDALADRDLVRRRPDPADRRKNIVELTDAGEKIRAGAAPAVDAVEASFLAPLSPPERETLLALLRRIVG
jgi:DNA-binding MarR family transcriptional regulator